MRGELGCVRGHCRALRAALAVGRFPAIILEDALSACDATAQEALTRALFARCESSIIVDVSNRPAPLALYNRAFELSRGNEGASVLKEIPALANDARKNSAESEAATAT